MRKPDSFWMLLLFAGLILFYFLSESILRQATVARINPDAVNVDAMLSDLPPALQQKIQDRITHTQLLTNLRKAVTPDEILSAMLALASFEKKPAEKEKLYTQIFRDYAEKPAAYPAYIFFMFNKEERLNRVTVADFMRIRKNCRLQNCIIPGVRHITNCGNSAGKKITNRNLNSSSRSMLINSCHLWNIIRFMKNCGHPLWNVDNRKLRGTPQNFWNKFLSSAVLQNI